MPNEIADMSRDEFLQYFKNVVDEKECEYLDLLVKGLKYADIAKELNVSSVIISIITNNLYQKFQCNDRPELVNLLLKKQVYTCKRNF